MKDHLKPGYKLAQSTHAMASFAKEHQEAFLDWEANSNYLCCLETTSFTFDRLIDKLELLRIRYSKFYEPDIDEVTALAVGPLDRSTHKKLFKKLKLTLS